VSKLGDHKGSPLQGDHKGAPLQATTRVRPYWATTGVRPYRATHILCGKITGIKDQPTGFAVFGVANGDETGEIRQAYSYEL